MLYNVYRSPRRNGKDKVQTMQLVQTSRLTLEMSPNDAFWSSSPWTHKTRPTNVTQRALSPIEGRWGIKQKRHNTHTERDQETGFHCGLVRPGSRANHGTLCLLENFRGRQLNFKELVRMDAVNQFSYDEPYRDLPVGTWWGEGLRTLENPRGRPNDEWKWKIHEPTTF